MPAAVGTRGLDHACPAPPTPNGTAAAVGTRDLVRACPAAQPPSGRQCSNAHCAARAQQPSGVLGGAAADGALGGGGFGGTPAPHTGVHGLCGPAPNFPFECQKEDIGPPQRSSSVEPELAGPAEEPTTSYSPAESGCEDSDSEETMEFRHLVELCYTREDGAVVAACSGEYRAGHEGEDGLITIHHVCAEGAGFQHGRLALSQMQGGVMSLEDAAAAGLTPVLVGELYADEESEGDASAQLIGSADVGVGADGEQSYDLADELESNPA